MLNPIPARPVEEAQELKRQLWCINYEHCLDIAILKEWENFSCSNCTEFESSKRTGEGSMDDAEGCAELVGVVLGFRVAPAFLLPKITAPVNGEPSMIQINGQLGACKGRLRDECFLLYRLLLIHRRITLKEMVELSGIHLQTVRRWLDSFSKGMDLRIERGVVIIGDGELPGPKGH